MMELLKQGIRISSRSFKSSNHLLLEKIEGTIEDSSLKKEIHILKDKIRGIYQGSIQEKLEINDELKEKYNMLSRAIKENRKGELLYYSYKKGENNRIIRPIDLYLY